MYLVVSRWKAKKGKETEFFSRGKSVRDALRKQAAVKMLEYFVAENGDVVAIHGYRDEKAYQRIVHDPKGAFNKAVDKFKLEEVSKWVSSDRGVAGKD